jgi:glycine cleavage system H protein
MSDHLVFPMGEYAARIPADRRYARNHMWAQRRETVYRFGLSDYAVRLLQDVYFLDWTVAAGTEVAERQEIGAIESKKAESALYAPIAGRLTEFNQELLHDPTGINIETYGDGWLFEIAGAGENLMTAAEYVEYLASVWEATQRTIKGQWNR